MKKINILNLFIFVLSLTILLNSCTPTNKQTLAILSCETGDSIPAKAFYSPKLTIKRFDILDISITDATAKLTELSPCVNGFIQDGVSGSQASSNTLLVDENGIIKLNCVGDIEAVGKTLIDIQNEITKKLKPFISSPLVVARLKNFKYSVEGEVGAPGTKTVENTRATILEAIAISGGLKIFAQKDSVLIIRELPNGKIEKGYVNLNNKNIINSPYYYLQQNDYVYVPPTKKRRINEDRTLDRYIGVGASIIGTISSIALFILTLKNN